MPAAAINPWTERTRINLSWLFKMRWAAIAGQLTAIAVVSQGMGIDLPLAKMLGVIGIAATTNLGLGLWLRRSPTAWPAWFGRGQWLAGSLMMLDNLFLTVLLYYTGGASNPFTVFYLVNIALAAAVLPARWAWGLDAAAFACFALLFFVHVSLAALEHGPDHEHAMHHHATPIAAGPMTLHLVGSVIAFGGAATFIVYFITRIATELARREAELDEARQQQAKSEKLDALATLAAGAAHELATPLSTIAVVARDLELNLEAGVLDDESVQHMRLIRSELDRCRRILDDMAFSAGESAGEEWTRTSADDFLGALLSNVTSSGRIDLCIDPELDGLAFSLPKRVVCQALGAIVQNALQASPTSQQVEIQARHADDSLVVSITDHGPGMSDETRRRAGEPFFTTKEPGSGMGLGLYLARRVVERLNGNLTIDSALGRGTTVTVRLPLRRVETLAVAASR